MKPNLRAVDNQKPSRQRLWQLRHQAQGLCVRCSLPAIPGMVLCLKHNEIARARYATHFPNTKTARALGIAENYDTLSPEQVFECLLESGSSVAVERFWTRVDKSPGLGPNGSCWEWIGILSKGYGHFYVYNQKRVRAHRIAYFLEYGYWARPLCRHTCDNRRCCNPGHLLEGSNVDNMRDMVARGRSLVGALNPAARLPHTRPRGESQGLARLRNADIPVIRQRVSSGETKTAVAVDYGVHRATIGRVMSGETWRHV